MAKKSGVPSYHFWMNRAWKAQGHPAYSPNVCCYKRDRPDCLLGARCVCTTKKPEVKV